MKCEYCGNEKQLDGFCLGCGAKVERKIEKENWKSEPFFYNGYICYTLHRYEIDCYEVQFWLGMELIERISVERQILRERVPEYCDPMPFFWDLFMLAHGEKDALEWKEKNNKYPATFLITRIENKDKEYMHSLSMRDLAKVSKV